jgi:hypothetical protein
MLQRKTISPNDFADLDQLAERIIAFQDRYNTTATLTASMSSTGYAIAYVENVRCSRRPSFGYGLDRIASPARMSYSTSAFTPPATACAHRPDMSGSNPSARSRPPKRWSVRAINS